MGVTYGCRAVLLLRMVLLLCVGVAPASAAAVLADSYSEMNAGALSVSS